MRVLACDSETCDWTTEPREAHGRGDRCPVCREGTLRYPTEAALLRERDPGTE